MIFTIFVHVAYMSVPRSSSGMFTIGRITYRWQGILFPIDNALCISYALTAKGIIRSPIARGETMFAKLGVQFLGLVYCTEQNTDVYPVSWTAVCYVTVITLFIKKLGWSVQFFFFGGGAPPVVAPLPITSCSTTCTTK